MYPSVEGAAVLFRLAIISRSLLDESSFAFPPSAIFGGKRIGYDVNLRSYNNVTSFRSGKFHLR